MRIGEERREKYNQLYIVSLSSMSVSGLTDIRRFIILYFNQLSICLPDYIILQHETRLTVTSCFVESDFVVLALVTTTELMS